MTIFYIDYVSCIVPNAILEEKHCDGIEWGRTNTTYRKLSRQRSVFPSDTALLKALYLSTFEATKDERCRYGTGDRFTAN